MEESNFFGSILENNGTKLFDFKFTIENVAGKFKKELYSTSVVTNHRGYKCFLMTTIAVDLKFFVKDIRILSCN